MRELLSLNTGKLLFYDIETAPLVPELEIDTPLYYSWEYKANKTGEKTSDEVIASFSKEAGLYPEFSKIVCIVAAKVIDNKIVLHTFKDKKEEDLLLKFNNLVTRLSNNKLVGFVNKGFDTPFVFKRMLINGIKPSDTVDNSGLKPWEIDEVDLAEMWKGGSFNRASLINIATAFGLPSPKDDINGSEVGKVYWEGGLDRIAEYCKKDVITTVNVYRKMRLEEPLAVATKKVKQKPKGLLERLFDGEEFVKKDEANVIARLKGFSKGEQEKAITLMGAIVSTAKGKKTKLTKAAVNRMKKALNE